ncbi:MAG: sugar phosphate isomerase/epimerase [Actinomycetota bacterium]
MMSLDKVAGAPISWGVCEVPGWGHQLAPERVLAEMGAIGLPATEMGSIGWLPGEQDALLPMLEPHGLRILAGFVPLVLHDPTEREETIAAAKRSADSLAGAGASYFNSAAVTTWDWGPRQPLDDAAWAHMGQMLDEVEVIVRAAGLEQVVHPHVDTVIETAEEIERFLDLGDHGIVFDTGHLAIGGVDLLDFVDRRADRIGLVHLKEVVMEVGRRLAAGEVTLFDAVREGVFPALGDGDLPIAESIRALRERGYDGWYVLEQDCALTEGDPPLDGGPQIDVRRSVDFLRSLDA